MNIAIEEVSSLRRRLRIEVPASRVDEEMSKISQDFQKVASIKGFRAGKAPRSVVEKKYASEIEEEVKRKLVPEAFREAIRTKKLKVVNAPSIEELNFQKGISMSFSTVVDLAPEFALPEYKGITVKKAETEVTDADVQQVIDRLREQQADHQAVSGRPVQNEDFAVIGYTGTVDGKPIKEIVPDASSLGEQEKFWLWVKDDIFIPGFAKQLIGANAGDSREVTVTFPEDFHQEALRGKTGVYQVKVEEVRERILPEFNDELAQKIAGKNAEELKTLIRENIAQDKETRARNEHLKQIFDHLREKASFELPESTVENETQRVLYDIVRENQMRGIPESMLEEKKGDILSAAQTSARDRVKLGFILSRIAEAEKIEVTPEEMNAELQALAARMNLSIDKLIKRIQENNNLGQVEEDLINRKTIDFLLQSASIA